MKITVLIAVVLALIGGSLAVRERSRRLSGEVSVRDLTLERDRLQNELNETKQRIDQMGHRASEAEIQAASLKDDFSRIFSNRGFSETAANSRGPATSTTVFVPGASRPSMSFSLRPRSRRLLDTTYCALYRQLKLSSEQIDQFKAVMIDSAARFEDVRHDAHVKNLKLSDPTVQHQFAQVNTELRQQLSGKFGVEALPIIEHFSETLFLRDAIGQLALELFYTDTPLNEPQADQLVEILAKNMRDPGGHLNVALADMTAIKAEAEKTLAPAQLNIWREFIDFEAKALFGALDRL